MTLAKNWRRSELQAQACKLLTFKMSPFLYRPSSVPKST